MSGQATGWVLLNGPRPDDTDRTDKPYGARARGLRSVLVAVADAANVRGEHAHPGTDNVAAAALYSRRQTINLLHDLVAEGWLEVTEQGGGQGMATTYRLLCDRRPTVQPLHPQRVQPAPERVQSAALTVQPRLHPNGLATAPTNEEPSRDTATVSPFDPDDSTEHLAASFELFWQAYPRHEAKSTARKLWPPAVKAAGGARPIIEGAERYAADPNREDQYTAHPSTWLRAERWNDAPLPARKRSPREAARSAIASNRNGTAKVVKL